MDRTRLVNEWRNHYRKTIKTLRSREMSAEQILRELLSSGDALFDVCDFESEQEALGFIKNVMNE